MVPARGTDHKVERERSGNTNIFEHRLRDGKIDERRFCQRLAGFFIRTTRPGAGEMHHDFDAVPGRNRFDDTTHFAVTEEGYFHSTDVRIYIFPTDRNNPTDKNFKHGYRGYQGRSFQS